MKSRSFDMVVAATDTLPMGIGMGNQLPWHLPREMRHFRDVTLGTGGQPVVNAVIMGRLTYESIPSRFRPLSGRINVVVSRSPSLALPSGVLLAHSLDDALDKLQEYPPFDGTAFLIGGAGLFVEGLLHDSARYTYLTLIDHPFECDVTIPHIRSFSHWKEDPSYPLAAPVKENGISYTRRRFVRHQPHSPAYEP